MSLDRRLNMLEVTWWRQSVADMLLASASALLTVDAVLEETVRFLEIPKAQRVLTPSGAKFTDAEHAEMETWLPAIRRALRQQ
jgi:hypothetical protein